MKIKMICFAVLVLGTSLLAWPNEKTASCSTSAGKQNQQKNAPAEATPDEEGTADISPALRLFFWQI